jgi:hypothetical protein
MWPSCGLMLASPALCNVGSLCNCLATACLTRSQCCRLDQQEITHQFLAVENVSLQSIQTTFEASSASYSVCIQDKWLDQEATAYICLVPGVGMFGAVCAVPPCHSVPSLWCWMKPGDRCTLHYAHSIHLNIVGTESKGPPFAHFVIICMLSV